ncbi:protein TolQ [Luteimonas aestuarii]|uniref:Tol-Pal system protein TolQ n=1 Tax=Luteimonas aestuarii TaxID=453837 RepID=A0A4R5TRL8_9GAMM|nr:protein TolQ [Luteimonas aestuarii]TDK20499.1 protein TolQ [Luteimonas aestuarii]
MTPIAAMLLQATEIQPLPDESAATATQLADTATAAANVAAHGGINYFDLMLKASLPVQLIILLLLVGSVVSWVIIFRKSRSFKQANEDADDFEDRFWSGADLNKLYAGATDRNRMVNGLEAIFESGFREFSRLKDRRDPEGRAQLEGAQRAMRVAGTRELDRLERNLELLANIGSTAPYVGLVGTVFGIMVTMHDMLNSGEQAGIAAVAPGISEALFATAIGLFVAIPAVWAYNRFTTRVERLAVRYESFAEEFSSILQRQTPAG